MRITCLMVVVIAGTLSADDKSRERERAARVALALAVVPPGPNRAPPPRPAPKSYPEGYRAATADQLPLVVFVACQPKSVDGAVVAKVDAFGDVTGPAVVVGFPVGDRVYIDATLKGDPSRTEVEKAIEAARRKIELPPAKKMPAAPKPLSWDL